MSLLGDSRSTQVDSSGCLPSQGVGRGLSHTSFPTPHGSYCPVSSKSLEIYSLEKGVTGVPNKRPSGEVVREAKNGMIRQRPSRKSEDFSRNKENSPRETPTAQIVMDPPTK